MRPKYCITIVIRVTRKLVIPSSINIGLQKQRGENIFMAVAEKQRYSTWDLLLDWVFSWIEVWFLYLYNFHFILLGKLGNSRSKFFVLHVVSESWLKFYDFYIVDLVFVMNWLNHTYYVFSRFHLVFVFMPRWKIKEY